MKTSPKVQFGGHLTQMFKEFIAKMLPTFQTLFSAERMLKSSPETRTHRSWPNSWSIPCIILMQTSWLCFEMEVVALTIPSSPTVKLYTTQKMTALSFTQRPSMKSKQVKRSPKTTETIASYRTTGQNNFSENICHPGSNSRLTLKLKKFRVDLMNIILEIVIFSWIHSI